MIRIMPGGRRNIGAVGKTVEECRRVQKGGRGHVICCMMSQYVTRHMSAQVD